MYLFYGENTENSLYDFAAAYQDFLLLTITGSVFDQFPHPLSPATNDLVFSLNFLEINSSFVCFVWCMCMLMWVCA